MTRKKHPVIEYESYLFSIISSKLFYDFSGYNACDRGIYSEYMSLELSAECFLPPKENATLFELVFLGSRDMERDLYDQEYLDEKMSPIGRLTVKKGARKFLGTLPADSLWHVARAIDRGSFKSIVLHGEKARYGRAKIISADFSMSHDPDDL